jgi:hypothetical protein
MFVLQPNLLGQCLYLLQAGAQTGTRCVVAFYVKLLCVGLNGGYEVFEVGIFAHVGWNF